MTEKSLDPGDYDYSTHYELDDDPRCANVWCKEQAEDELGTGKCRDCSFMWAEDHEDDANPAVQAVARRVLREIRRLEDEELARCGK